MAAKQGIIRKTSAKNKNSKYTVKVTKTVSQTAKNGKQTTKHKYSKKIYKNGKYYYYY